MNGVEKISEKDFPNLYLASDEASKLSQRNYLIILGVDLISMIVAASLAIYNYESARSKEEIYILSGFLLLLSLFLSIVLLAKKFEDTWYQGRALAESCKTLTWRFMTCSEMFEYNISTVDATKKFVTRIKELGKEFSELNKSLNAKTLTLPVCTSKMVEVRNLPILDRKMYYLTNRIEDQKEWYSKKAEFNKNRYNVWFTLIITCQFLSIVSIAFLIRNPESNWNVVGLFTTLASSAISWLQIKQHQELKQAYTTATQELNFIAELSLGITTDDELAKFVLDSENAISREHTLWLAQKRK